MARGEGRQWRTGRARPLAADRRDVLVACAQATGGGGPHLVKMSYRVWWESPAWLDHRMVDQYYRYYYSY